MLSVIDIIRALSSCIESNFPDYPVVDRDLEEGFPRPCYFIDINSVVSESLTHKLVKDTADIEIDFLAEDIYKGFLNLLDVKNKLVKLFSEPLALTDERGNVMAHVVFNDVRTEVIKVDKALICNLSTELVQEIEDNVELPLIEDLQANIDVN